MRGVLLGLIGRMLDMMTAGQEPKKDVELERDPYVEYSRPNSDGWDII
jgi:hypothetical protein